MGSFRFDEKLKEELDFLKAHLGLTQTQVIKEAIHARYEYLQNQEKTKKSPEDIFRESGYLSSFSGKKDLSANYKKDLAGRLKEKHEAKE